MVMLTRRNMIQAGAAAGLLGAVGAPAAAQMMTPLKPYIDPRLKARALLALAANRSRVPNADVIGIADFSRPSRDPRFYIMDLRSGMLTQHLCAHGRGSDPAHSGWLEYFSNSVGSEATSNGAYVTGDAYFGKYGHSMRLYGLDHTNSNALDRAIVVHSAWYAEPSVIAEYGKLGRSEGCFALPGISHAEAMTRLGSGRLLYADKV
nr:murein L,D-transpeptidase catalytic domain family protein [uncultured Sphingosinicella sp.]